MFLGIPVFKLTLLRRYV